MQATLVISTTWLTASCPVVGTMIVIGRDG
jgi:hypothetical protein